MKLKKKILFKAILLIVLSTYSFNLKASYSAMGCVSDDTGWLYPDNAYVTREDGYGPSYSTSTVITTFGFGNYCSPQRGGRCVIRSRNDCRDCTGPYDYDSSKRGKDMWYEQKGRIYTYMACPIDDYAGLLLAGVAGIGLFFLRRVAIT
ncbi:MAG: hypothetical protein V4541_07290 [Bacteroidota bacterium]